MLTAYRVHTLLETAMGFEPVKCGIADHLVRPLRHAVIRQQKALTLWYQGLRA